MLFNTLQFGIFMILVVISIELFRKRNYQIIILLFASYVFYYFSSGILFLLLLYSSLLDFFIGKKIYYTKDFKKRKFYLFLSLFGNLALLAFFKYADFGIQTVNYLTGLVGFSLNLSLLNLVLPVGISFFTFQTLSYTIDIYRNKLEPTRSFFKFALFVSFFPQLVAGPIVRAADFLPQLKRKVVVKAANLKLGLTLIGWGLVKKVVFANNIAPYVDNIFTDPTGFGSFIIILGTFAFGVQIYCDFSAYTDIAIGCARIFGFHFPKNFDKPYFAKDPSDFWRRWHISLSSWLRDYLYIPLGGNRKGKFRTNINLMVTMLLGGLWHGASWNFIIWGGYHGFLLVLNKFFKKYNPLKIFKGKLSLVLSIIFTQYFIFLGWLIFRVKDMNHLFYSIKKFLFIDFFMTLPQMFSYILDNLWLFVLLSLFLYIHFVSFKVKDIISLINGLRLKFWFVFVTFVILLLFLFSPSLNTAFIYFQF